MLTDKQRQQLEKELLAPEAVPKLWKWVHRSAMARIWLRAHYLAQASLEQDRLVNK